MTFPTENDSILIIDADAVKALPVSFQGFQVVSRRGAQVDESMRSGQHIQLAQCSRDDVGRKTPRPRAWTAMIEVFGVGVAKRENQSGLGKLSYHIHGYRASVQPRSPQFP